MPISDKYHCIFVHIPKTGGSSIEKALDLFGEWKIEDRKKLFGLIQSDDLLEKKFLSDFLQHLKMNEINTINLSKKNYYSFSFVRNPWDRMVSIYHNLDPNLKAKALSKNIDLSGLSFSDFLYAIKEVNHIHTEEQWRFVYNKKNGFLVDFIGHLENINDDFNLICNKLKINKKLPHDNKSDHDSYQHYYTANTQQFIATWYQRDIELFSYKF